MTLEELLNTKISLIIDFAEYAEEQIDNWCEDKSKLTQKQLNKMDYDKQGFICQCEQCLENNYGIQNLTCSCEQCIENLCWCDQCIANERKEM